MADESAQSAMGRHRQRSLLDYFVRAVPESVHDSLNGGVDEFQTKRHRLESNGDNVDVSVPHNGHEKREDEPKEQPETDIEKIQIVSDADKVELFGTMESIEWAERLIKDVIAEADAGGSPSLVARGLAASGGEKCEIQVLVEKLGSSSSIMSSSPLSKADPSAPSEGVVQVDEDYYLGIEEHDYFVSFDPQKIPQGYFVKQLQCESEGIRYFHVHKDGEGTYDIVMVGILNVIDSTAWIAGTKICDNEEGFTLNENILRYNKIFLPPLALSYPTGMTPTEFKSKYWSVYMAMLSSKLKCAFKSSGYDPDSCVFDEELCLSLTGECLVPHYLSPHECDGCGVKEQLETDIEKSDVGSAEEAEIGSDTRSDKVTCKERCTIQSLQDNSTAKIQIVSDADKVELFGTLESIKWAEKLIKDVIAEADAGGSRSLVDRLFGTVQPASGGEQHGIQVPADEADAGGSPSLVARGLAASGGEKREIQVLVEKLGVVEVDEYQYLGIDEKRDYFVSFEPQKIPKGYIVKLQSKSEGIRYFHVHKDGEGTYDIVMVGILNIIDSTAWIAGTTICDEEAGFTRYEDIELPPLALSYPTGMNPREYKSKYWSNYTAMLSYRLKRATRKSGYDPALLGFDEELCLSLTGESEKMPRNISPHECDGCGVIMLFTPCKTCGGSLPPNIRPSTCNQCDEFIIDGFCKCNSDELPAKCDVCSSGFIIDNLCTFCDVDDLSDSSLQSESVDDELLFHGSIHNLAI